MSRDLRPYAQWPKPKSQVNAPVIVLSAWAEDNDGWAIIDPAGVPLAEDADGFLVFSDEPEAVTERRTRVVGETETVVVI